MLTQFPENKVGRDIVVGDIHGCYDQLMAALESINFNKKVDRLFSVGDLIDRGPDSLKCLELLFEPWFHSVLGNHEQLMIDALADNNEQDIANWFGNGGRWVLEDGSLIGSERLDQVLSEVKALPVAIQIGDIGIVHAEPPSDWLDLKAGKKNKPWFKESIIWSRERLQDLDKSECQNIGHVFVGHCVLKKLIVTLGNVTYIDAGTFATGDINLIDMKDFIASNRPSQAQPLIDWLSSDKPNKSSNIMSHVMFNIPYIPTPGRDRITGARNSHPTPVNASELERCIAFIRSVPEARDRLYRVSDISDDWKTIIDQWSELEIKLDEGRTDAINDILYELGDTWLEQPLSLSQTGLSRR